MLRTLSKKIWTYHRYQTKISSKCFPHIYYWVDEICFQLRLNGRPNLVPLHSANVICLMVGKVVGLLWLMDKKTYLAIDCQWFNSVKWSIIIVFLQTFSVKGCSTLTSFCLWFTWIGPINWPINIRVKLSFIDKSWLIASRYKIGNRSWSKMKDY